MNASSKKLNNSELEVLKNRYQISSGAYHTEYILPQTAKRHARKKPMFEPDGSYPNKYHALELIAGWYGSDIINIEIYFYLNKKQETKHSFYHHIFNLSKDKVVDNWDYEPYAKRIRRELRLKPAPETFDFLIANLLTETFQTYYNHNLIKKIPNSHELNDLVRLIIHNLNDYPY